MTESWRSIFAPLLNVFLKSNCPLCDRVAADVLCQYCHRQLLSCELADPDRDWMGDLPLFAWGNYEGALKQSIAKLKYDKNQDIALLLGEFLAMSWQKHSPQIPDNIKVMPIPLHPDKLKKRGFNQAESIARRFCELTGTKLDLSLQRDRDTIAQFGLTKQQRAENVADAFSLAPKSKLRPGDRAILLDDIYTTGSTARSAKLTLERSNITAIGIMAIAAGRR
jgi:ComF family protein